jgi:hypothetical protein
LVRQGEVDKITGGLGMELTDCSGVSRSTWVSDPPSVADAVEEFEDVDDHLAATTNDVAAAQPSRSLSMAT